MSTKSSDHCTSQAISDPTDVALFFDRLASDNPNPCIALNFDNQFTLLVAVVLSAQSTDVAVNRVTQYLFKIANTPKQMLELGEDRLKEYIRVLGLFNNKARNIIRLSSSLVEHHQGNIPNSRAALERLPGVGRKSAGVILNVAFGYNAIPVDTHVFRLCNRTGLAVARTPEQVERILEQVIPPHRKRQAHHWLVLHGRHVCVARKPKCSACLVNDLCTYPNKTKQ